MEFVYEPPGRQAPVAPARRFGSFNLGSALAKMAGPSLVRQNEPRKGTNPKGVAPLQSLRAMGMAERPVKRERSLNPMALKALCERDDILYSIRSTIRRAIGEMKWSVTPDLDAIKADLKRWETVVLCNLSLPGMDLEFHPHAMSLEMLEKARGALKAVLREVLKAGDDPATSTELRTFFANVVAAHDAIAQSHIAAVEKIFDSPNTTQTTFREFLDLLVDDITLFDAGVVIKNAAMDGTLGELYHIPGWQIRPYRAKDRSTPAPPNVAYDWVVEGRTAAYYNNAELVYIAAHPQASGYGMSPAEVLVEQMVGGLYGDAYLIDTFRNSNMPYFVFDTGPVTEGERRAIERRWDERVSAGQHRGIFIANADGVKGFMPIPAPADKDSSTIEKLKFWANRKCAAYGLSLNDIGFTEDLHRTTSETQADLTQTRGIDSFAVVVEAKLNSEVVRGQMWVRDDPEDTNSFEGRMKPIFPFADVKLAFERGSKDDRLQIAEQAIPLVQAGVWSINEARHEMDEPPVVGGDTHVVFSAGLKVSDLPNLPAPPDPNAPPPMPGGPGGDPNAQGGPPGAQGGPALPPGAQGALPPGAQGGAPQGAPVQKSGLDSIESVAERLRKLVLGET